MKNDIKLKSEISITEFLNGDKKDILMLYEALGKEICRNYDFDYFKLLKMMLTRETKRRD